ncbi:6600_t:CDS:10, partial [Entrophospora sp. SA101]
MAQSIEVVISFASLLNCHVNLPPVFSAILYENDKLPQNVILEISWLETKVKQHKAYVGWSGGASRSSNVQKLGIVEIDPQFGTAIGLKDGQKVSIKICENIQDAKSVFVEPCTIEDWEIVDHRAGYLENYFIQQLHVVYPNQIITLWINSNLTQLKIVEINPKCSFAKLSSKTEVYVTPKPRKPLKPSETNDTIKSDDNTSSSLPSIYCLRVLPIEYLVESSKSLLDGYDDRFCTVNVHPSDFAILGLQTTQAVVCLSKVKPNYLTKDTATTADDSKDIENKNHLVQKLFVKVLINFNVTPGHVAVGEYIRDYLDCEHFSIVRLTPAHSNFTSISTINIHNTSNQIFPKIHQNGRSSIEFISNLAGVSNLSEKLEDYLRSCLGKAFLRIIGGLLLCGSRGSGKTNVLTVKCTEHTEERISTLREKLQLWFDDAAWHAPSIILFDDIDRLIPAEVEHVDSFRFRQIAECFFQIASKMIKRHQISIFATAQQQESVHKLLITTHLFSEIKLLNPPTKIERRDILEAIMSSGPTSLQKSVSSLDLLSIASDCEGYLAADLKALVERAIHEGATKKLYDDVDVENADDGGNVKDFFLLTQDDFQKAHEGFVPISLRGVKLHTSDVSWADIGGLEETKNVLLETLEWPTKYASIFANCPLRLRSGVKGPELLNKYIGASEKSVRDLFDRAQAAKPCVLFFDEFDSIAPKRGHDSTGVTDRVVNQMLTQMDGAEGLEGVYVLAATSRPDLIDPALLRPGRLDKSLLCNMPTQKERFDILKALSRKMELSEDVDLDEYSKKCEHYSGADLQALLYNAHLEAIHDIINAERILEGSDEIDTTKFVSFNVNSINSANTLSLTAAEKTNMSHMLKITDRHMQISFKMTKPSTTPQEYIRLAEIYHEFVTGRNGEMPSGIASHEIGQRATL